VAGSKTRRQLVGGCVCLRNSLRPSESGSHLSGFSFVNVGLGSPAWQWRLGGRGGRHFNKHLPIGPSPSSIFTTLSTVPVSSILTTLQPLPPHTWPRFFRPWCKKVAYLLWPILRHSTVLFSPDEQCTKMRVVGFTGCCFTTSDPHNITRFKTQASKGLGGSFTRHILPLP
jgi:hypothetical protein